MAQIKWTKEDVIKKFQEAMVPQSQGDKPQVMQDLLNRAKDKRKPPEEEVR